LCKIVPLLVFVKISKFDKNDIVTVSYNNEKIWHEDCGLLNGILEPGMEYFFRAISGDIDTTDPLITIHSRLENRATEWEEFNTAPIPEPATMLLLGSGLLGVVGYGRKKFFKK